MKASGALVKDWLCGNEDVFNVVLGFDVGEQVTMYVFLDKWMI